MATNDDAPNAYSSGSTKRENPEETDTDGAVDLFDELDDCAITDDITGILVYCNPCKRWFQDYTSWYPHSIAPKHLKQLSIVGANGDGEAPQEIPLKYIDRALNLLKSGDLQPAKRRRVANNGLLNPDADGTSNREVTRDHPWNKNVSTDESGHILYCKPCNLWVGHWLWKMHSTSSTHKSNVVVSGTKFKESRLARIDSGTRKMVKRQKTKCHLCRTDVLLVDWKDHAKSQMHRGEVEAFLRSPAPKDNSHFRCVTCCIDLHISEWTRHRASRIHAIMSDELLLFTTRSGQYRWNSKLSQLVKCELCKIHVGYREFEKHNKQYWHVKRYEHFRQLPQVDLLRRPCYSCYAFVKHDDWYRHLKHGDHVVRALSYPRPLPPPILRRCGICDIEIPFTNWNAHVKTHTHAVTRPTDVQMPRKKEAKKEENEIEVISLL